MEKSKIIKFVMLGAILVILAFYMEKADQVLDQGYNLDRKMPGEGTNEVPLILSPEGMDDIKYTVSVDEEIMMPDAIKECLESAKKEIDETFCRADEELTHVTEKVNIKDSYVNSLVEAEWTFSSYKCIDYEGNLIENKLSEEGEIIGVCVELTCNEVKEMYEFSFVAYPKSKNSTEKLLAKVDEAIEEQLSKAGTKVLELPSEVDGRKITWTQPKQYMVIKILLLEAVMVILYFLSKKENEKNERKKLEQEMELDYSEIVSKMAILMGSGMSIKQAWNKISARYLDERNKNRQEKRAIYEYMVLTMREISDGENELKAYQNFGERTGLSSYHRFARILVSSLQKGNREICETLEHEAQEAFENRRMYARKLGEEASTKMLVPLLLMMVIVIAIVIAPAIVSFNG